MKIKQGIGCYISPSAIIMDGADIELGDHVYIGENVRIMPGILKIGDYSKIHNNVFINPQKHVILGHLTWIGQNSILDGTGGLTAGNYLGVGMGSCLYSHIRHGDLMQGCRFERNTELIIEDDVWFVGQCMVSPIFAASKSMAMLGSVITKNMIYNNVYGGNPAKNITDKVGYAYEYDEGNAAKLAKFLSYVEEYKTETKNDVAILAVESYPDTMCDDVTYYNISKRTYTKRNTESEIKFNKWLFKYKAKFIPAT